MVLITILCYRLHGHRLTIQESVPRTQLVTLTVRRRLGMGRTAREEGGGLHLKRTHS